jgi:hypothetical protein
MTRTRRSLRSGRIASVFWFLAVCLTMPAWAGIDPDGDPARELRVEPHARGKIAMTAVRVTERTSADGERYLVLDYSLRNNNLKPIDSHQWSVTQGEVIVSGTGTGKVAPGATMNFSQVISGTGIGAFTGPGTLIHATVGLAGRVFVTCPPPDLARCEQNAATANALGLCSQTCLKQGYQGGQSVCTGRTVAIGVDQDGRTCYDYVPSCQCSGEAYLPAGTTDLETFINIHDEGRPIEYRLFDRFQASPRP